MEHRIERRQGSGAFERRSTIEGGRASRPTTRDRKRVSTVLLGLARVTYAGDPRSSPVVVTVASPSTLAMPKSLRTARPVERSITLAVDVSMKHADGWPLQGTWDVQTDLCYSTCG